MNTTKGISCVATLILVVAWGWGCRSPQARTRSDTRMMGDHPDQIFDDARCAPCEPVPVLSKFGTNVALDPGLPVDPGSSYQWYRLKDDKFKKLTGSEPGITNIQRAVLSFPNFQMANVGIYGRKTQGQDPKIPCDAIFSLMGYGGTNGMAEPITVYGTPYVASGNSTSSYCAGQPCPGAYTRYISYSTGWRIVTPNLLTRAEDGSARTAPKTKLRYYCAPPITPPSCGCEGVVDILNPTNKLKTYTFTIYFPSGVTPDVPHPLKLYNLAP